MAVEGHEEHQRLAGRVQESLFDFALTWEHLGLDERRHLLRHLIEKLEVDREGRDAVIKLKVHLLPERKVRLSVETMHHMKERPIGAAALTRRELAYLYHVGQNI